MKFTPTVAGGERIEATDRAVRRVRGPRGPLTWSARELAPAAAGAMARFAWLPCIALLLPPHGRADDSCTAPAAPLATPALFDTLSERLSDAHGAR